VGPVKDVYNIGENPQFRLEVGPGTGEVWLLLTRHIVDIVDFKENREYITVLVYKTSGGRVFYPRKCTKKTEILLETDSIRCKADKARSTRAWQACSV